MPLQALFTTLKYCYAYQERKHKVTDMNTQHRKAIFFPVFLKAHIPYNRYIYAGKIVIENMKISS